MTKYSEGQIKKLQHVIEFFEQLNLSNTDDKYEKLFTYLSKFIKFEHGTLFFFNKSTNKLDKFVSTGKTVDLIDEIYFKFGYGLSGWNAKKKRMLLLNNLKTLNNNRDVEICSFLSLPIISEMNLVGVLNLSHSKENAFSLKKIKLLEMMMPLLASFITKECPESRKDI